MPSVRLTCFTFPMFITTLRKSVALFLSEKPQEANQSYTTNYSDANAYFYAILELIKYAFNCLNSMTDSCEKKITE